MEEDALTPTRHDITPAEHVGPLIPGAVGDNYPGYYRAHFGYQYDVEELMSPEERRLKATLTRVDDAALSQMLAGDHNPLERLLLAHACLRLGRVEDALAELERVLDSTPYHAAVAYEEVMEGLAELALEIGDSARAEQVLRRAEQLFGESWSRMPWWGGVMAWMAGLPEEADELWQKYVTGEDGVDPESAYEVAEWLVNRGEDEAHKEAARAFLERSELAAKERGIRAVLVDIELLRARL